MLPSSTIRAQIESALAHKIPSALTPPARIVRPLVSTGISELDGVIQGGFPVDAVTELVGGEYSGRTWAALSFLSRITSAGKVCAGIDASNSFHPASAASVGVDLKRLLWVCCGVQENVAVQDTRQFSLPVDCFKTKPITKGLHGGGHGTHPRSEVKVLSAAVDRFLAIAKQRPNTQTYVSSLLPATTAVRRLSWVRAPALSLYPLLILVLRKPKTSA